MTIEIGMGNRRFLAHWSEEYLEMVVGKEIKKGIIDRYLTKREYPYVIIKADTLEEANILAAKMKSVGDIFKMAGCPIK